jgi:hypothetical protein
MANPSKGTSMTDCPNCEYHRKRTQLWREEAYKQAGHPLPERGWVGLTDEDKNEILLDAIKHKWNDRLIVEQIESKLKEKNT